MRGAPSLHTHLLLVDEAPRLIYRGGGEQDNACHPCRPYPFHYEPKVLLVLIYWDVLQALVQKGGRGGESAISCGVYILSLMMPANRSAGELHV